MSVSCECYVLSGRGICDELITRPEESYRLWRVVLCELETSWMRRPWPTRGCCSPPPPKLLPCVIMMHNYYSKLIKYKFYNLIMNFLLIWMLKPVSLQDQLTSLYKCQCLQFFFTH
jgi:hypothetical protein